MSFRAGSSALLGHGMVSPPEWNVESVSVPLRRSRVGDRKNANVPSGRFAAEPVELGGAPLVPATFELGGQIGIDTVAAPRDRSAVLRYR